MGALRARVSVRWLMLALWLADREEARPGTLDRIKRCARVLRVVSLIGACVSGAMIVLNLLRAFGLVSH